MIKLVETERLGRIGRLTILGTPDAMQALCRLARYEQERASKEAALGLIQLITKGYGSDSALPARIRQAIGEGERPSLQWVRQALEDWESPQGVDFVAWRELVDSEVALPTVEGDRGQKQQLVLSLCTRVSLWMNLRSDSNEAAVQFAMPYLSQVQDSTYAIQRFTVTLLDELKAPQLVTYLSEVKLESFEKDPFLMFLLAQSNQQLGNFEKAKEVARAASERLGNPTEEVKTLAKRNNLKMTELVANNRYTIAGRLARRGLFDWAESEYEKVGKNRNSF